jgi:tRNA-specific 2-thiouridylase
MRKRVVVGMSGGVDSSVAAYLLSQNDNYEVIGLFMKNWHDTEFTISNECPWQNDYVDALQVSQKLGIPFYTVDLSEEYYDRIVQYMFEEYSKGRTPNPDVLCNREIKFDVFLQKALALGADYVATGHYARKSKIDKNQNTIYRLMAGVDKNKDQTYFLCQLNQYQLSKALFPIGEYTKNEIREIAKNANLDTFDKKDSQGLCFVGKVKMPKFLSQVLNESSGDIIEIPNDGLDGGVDPSRYNDVIGTHKGVHNFTVGQRRGLGIANSNEPYFVLHLDSNTNRVYVGKGKNHSHLFRTIIELEDTHFVREDLKPFTLNLKGNGRIRYRQPLISCEVTFSRGKVMVMFDERVKGVSPGQFFALYQEEELIFSGVIK